MKVNDYPETPEGRYFVVRGRLWRKSNPHLEPGLRATLVKVLMAARRDVGQAKKVGDVAREKAARANVNRAKIALGERGPVWWTDGADDLNQHEVVNTAYAD